MRQRYYGTYAIFELLNFWTYQCSFIYISLQPEDRTYTKGRSILIINIRSPLEEEKEYDHFRHWSLVYGRLGALGLRKVCECFKSTRRMWAWLWLAWRKFARLERNGIYVWIPIEWNDPPAAPSNLKEPTGYSQ